VSRIVLSSAISWYFTGIFRSPEAERGIPMANRNLQVGEELSKELEIALQGRRIVCQAAALETWLS
jgi:hypothetical protein